MFVMTILAVWMSAPFSAADVPYDSLEKARRLHIAVEAAKARPEHPALKKCGPSLNYLKLNERLGALKDNENVVWSNATIVMSDLSLLKNRALNCKNRGSCQVYIWFLEKAVKDQESAPAVEALKDQVSQILETLKAEDYLKALSSLPNVCELGAR